MERLQSGIVLGAEDQGLPLKSKIPVFLEKDSPFQSLNT